MRQTFTAILGLTACLASTSRAFYSDYWTHWDDMMIEIDCPNGPVVCGTDEYGYDILCGDGLACYSGRFGSEC